MRSIKSLLVAAVLTVGTQAVLAQPGPDTEPAPPPVEQPKAEPPHGESERPSPDMIPSSGDPHATDPAPHGGQVEPAPHGAHPAHGAAPHAAAGHDQHAEPAVDASQYINWFGFDYGDKDIYGGPLGDGRMTPKDVHGQTVELDHEEKMSPPFIFMLINFGLLLIILGKFGAPAARKLAEERHDLIKNALDEAAKLRKQAQDKLTEYEARLKAADAEVKQLVDGLRSDAEADKQRILKAAEDQAAIVKKDAELRIAAEIASARAQLTKEVTAAAAAVSEKLLRDKSTTDDQTKLVAAFITDVQHTAIRRGGPEKEGAR